MKIQTHISKLVESVKAVLRGELITLNVYLRKENENCQINDTFPLQKTRKKDQNKLKEIIKIIQDKRERKKQNQLNKSKFLKKKSIKIYKPLVRQTTNYLNKIES